MKFDGYVCVPFTLEIETFLSSTGCLSASSILLENSGNSSRNNTHAVYIDTFPVLLQALIGTYNNHFDLQIFLSFERPFA